ncbi:hypothetical protein IEQ34_006618 [Dendrobium chrysotoxum]|uniref:HNH endonuclease n=1 Tax=Dendrobium chrysotoxum TaxID=161865 RepID=A0AAV7H7E6_DENCH|nr:hypothetical protein IEQ34_006618 [Dendrobium chrysotoxum]
MKLKYELSRSSKVKCCSCESLLGAMSKAVGEVSLFHILECHWDTKNNLVLCPIHASRRLPYDIAEIKKSNSTSVNPLVSSDPDISYIIKRPYATWMFSSGLNKG